MMTAFTQFKMKIDGKMRNFLAIPVDSGNIHVIGEDGTNYGSWFDITSFMKQKSYEKLGSARIKFQVIN